MTKTINDFKVGDLLVMTERFKRNGQDVTERRAAQVTCINWNGNGLVTYGPPDFNSGYYAKVFGAEVRLSTGSGAFKPEEIGTKHYGFYVAVEKVGNRAPWRPADTGWMYGHPGYDLMHDAPRRGR